MSVCDNLRITKTDSTEIPLLAKLVEIDLISIGHNKLEHDNITLITDINDTFSSLHKQLDVYCSNLLFQL